MNRSSTLMLFFILVLITCTLYFLTNEIIYKSELFYEYFDQQLDFSRIQKILELRDKWSWISYIIIPLIYLIKFTLISLWILSATILFGYKNTFKEIFHVVIIAEFVWLIPSFITLIWFGFIDTDYSLLDVQYFKPLSLLNFFEASEIDSWLVFPLQALNLFEIIYMLALAIGIKRILQKDYSTALNFTIPVYGSALITWIVFITFLSINLTA